MPVDVLGGFYLAVAHLVGYLYVRGAGRDQERGTDVTQLVSRVLDCSVFVSCRVAVGQAQVLAPSSVAEVTAAIAVNQPGVESAAALSSCE